MTGKAKSTVLYAGIIAAVMVGAGWLLLGQAGKPVNTMRRQPIDISQTNYLSNHSMVLVPVAERNKMSRKERFRWLEKYGRVPEDADYASIDWVLAQKTSWWGKPIDPKKFWKNKVLWSSVSARTAARRLGRFFPPIPYEDPITSNSSSKDMVSSYGVEGPSFSFKMNDKENVFWGDFDHKHPQPPEEIEREQQTAAGRYFMNRNKNIYTSNDVLRVKAAIQNDPVKLNYPQEACTEDALYWAYVYKSRQYYENNKHLPYQLTVDSKLITEPMTADQLKAANAWKLAYLQRLRREKTDEQYIQAYLKAWNLTEKDVFGEVDLK